MKYLWLAILLLFSVGAQAQTTSSSAGALSKVPAELSKSIDSKNAHVGDAVEAKTTIAVTLADGTQLPKGTRLTGKVTEVRAKSNADKTSHLAFSLDRAILHDGHEVSIHATLTAMSVPSLAAETAGSSVSADSSMPAMRGTGGGLPTSTLPAGASRSTQQVPEQVRTAVGNGVDGTGRPAGSVAQPTGETAANTAGAAVSGPHIDHVAVAHLPGVTFSSALFANDSGTLDATGQNISVEGGAQMTLIVRVGQK